jgi:hypothetical protein
VRYRTDAQHREREVEYYAGVGFFHHGRFAKLRDVIEHYNRTVGMVVGCYYGFVRHACSRSGLPHKIKKVRGPDMLRVIDVL